MRVLTGGVERVFAGRPVVIADRRARLHGIRGQALVDDVDLGDVVRLGKGCVDRRLVAEMPVETGVVLGIRPHLRGTGLVGICRRDDRRQFLIGDVDRFRRVPRLRQRLADDQSNLVANMSHAVLA